MNRPFIAHVRERDKAIQTVEEHALGVASLAETFASCFDMGEWGRLLGLLHDKGKERNSFQDYIRHAAGLDPESAWHGEDKQHAWIGASIASKTFGPAASILGFPIMGHHSGLDDYPHYEEKLRGEFPREVKEDSHHSMPSIPPSITKGFVDRKTMHRDMHHLVRMLFSCLVDADYLDTEAFMEPESAMARGGCKTLAGLAPDLENYLKQLKGGARQSPLNQLRAEIQERCRESALGDPGIYSLTVPTGGGKTLSSLVWAFSHALKHGKHRIIIAIPYTSIVTQTAQILADIFGQENVLEHHSNFDEQSISDRALRHRMKLATENWNYPIIVTTNVRLLESMLGNKPSVCRRLHNIANSVLIMDEIQTLPLDHFQPILDSLNAYQRLFGVSILFTTASMPAMEGYGSRLRGIQDVKEIIPAEWRLHEALRRTRLVVDLDPIDESGLGEHLKQHNRVLCVVNTRAQAKAVFEQLPPEGIRIHLSRMMCSAHLRKSIARLKACLKSDLQEPIRVVATQLIEAGVDIDFPVVFRQEAGLDSVLQAAGRCNREGRLPISDVFVFRLNRKPSRQIGAASDAWRNLDADSDWFAPKTMEQYFIQRYSRQDNFDKGGIVPLLGKATEWMFEEAASIFRLIDDNGAKSVVVNFEDSPALIEELKLNGPSYSLIKRLSQYTVNLHSKDFEELAKAGLIEEIIEGFFFIPDPAQYRDDVGLVTTSHWLEEILTV